MSLQNRMILLIFPNALDLNKICSTPSHKTCPDNNRSINMLEPHIHRLVIHIAFCSDTLLSYYTLKRFVVRKMEKYKFILRIH